MKKSLLLLGAIIFATMPSFAKNTNNLFLAKDTTVENLSNNLKANLSDSVLKDNTLYSNSGDFYYIKMYQADNNVNLFLTCDSKDLDKYTTTIKSSNTKVYALKDKDLTKEYNSEFQKFITLNDIKVDGVKVKDNAYNPYNKELSNRIINTTKYSQDGIDFTAHKLQMKTKIKKYVDGFEIVVTNNTGSNIILKKASTGDFMGLTEIAKKAALPTGADFVPVYGLIKGVQTDLEKNKFTRPFPIDYTVKNGESVKILGLAKLQVAPIIDFIFEINGKEKTIQFNTYQ